MIEKCKSAIDKGDSFGAPPLTDLSKAFDWLEQRLLLDKTTEPSFEHLGFEIKDKSNKQSCLPGVLSFVSDQFWYVSERKMATKVWSVTSQNHYSMAIKTLLL